ncbi:AMP-binding protein [Pseudonocardia sp. NPDC049154]|uniref:AMP-binding protein n=1 Tax=Pseudonocardia sp. NPDC049154 TaxID=3155501 RepID=UPI0033C795C8
MIRLLPPGDPTVPDRDSCVLELMLAERAAATPDAVLVRYADGTEWTYAQALAEGRRAAGVFAAHGVGPGDAVLHWLPNGVEGVQVVLGCALLGATVVPVNTALRGTVLAHVLRTSGARLLVAHRDLVDHLRGLEAPELLVAGEDWAAELAAATPWRGTSPREPWDPCAVLFTSGTTGPSKGVVTTSVQLYCVYTATPQFVDTPADRSLITAPFSHQVGLGTFYRAVLYGASVALAPRFDTAAFWQTVAETGCTLATLVGGQATFLVHTDGPEPGAHTLREVGGSPVTEDFLEFGRRFGVSLMTGFSMTELSSPIMAAPGLPPGSCGRVRAGVQVRLVDDHDRDVPRGTPGELVVRADRPWSLCTEYLGMPEATARAWRNGWFHTGDLLREDEAGFYYFVDRAKDCIRRRGENVSSFEVECELTAHPAVQAAAAVGVPGETGDQEVLAVLELVEGAELDPAELIEFLRPRLANFMIPRYVRVVDVLPVTASTRVRKEPLRAAGRTPDTWDREAAGVRVRADRFG